MTARQHPDEFVGKTVLAYTSCGPDRQNRYTIFVNKYDKESGYAYIQYADGREEMVKNADWYVDAEVKK